MAYPDFSLRVKKFGVTIDYNLLGKVLLAKQELINFPIIKDPTQYRERKLSIINTIYPD